MTVDPNSQDKDPYGVIAKNETQLRQDQGMTHEWQVISSEDGSKLTYHVVVKTKDNEDRVASMTFTGSSREQKLAQIASMKALKNMFKTLSTAQADFYLNKMRQAAFRPKIFTIKDSKTSELKGVVVAWPEFSSEGIKYHVRDEKEDRVWILDADTGHLPEAILGYYCSGLKQSYGHMDAWWKLWQVYRPIGTHLLGKHGRIGYQLSPDKKHPESPYAGIHQAKQMRKKLGTDPNEKELVPRIQRCEKILDELDRLYLSGKKVHLRAKPEDENKQEEKQANDTTHTVTALPQLTIEPTSGPDESTKVVASGVLTVEEASSEKRDD